MTDQRLSAEREAVIRARQNYAATWSNRTHHPDDHEDIRDLLAEIAALRQQVETLRQELQVEKDASAILARTVNDQAARYVALSAAQERIKAAQRYDLITNYRCGSSIEEMERADDGEWVRYEDVDPSAALPPLAASSPQKGDE